MSVSQIAGFAMNAAMFGISKIIGGLRLLRAKCCYIRTGFGNLVPITIVLPNGDKFPMIVDLNDEGLSYELITAMIRERENVSVLLNVLHWHNPKTIIDIGSNIGFFPIIEGRYSSDSEIYAMEPVSKNRDLLKLNLYLNDLASRTTILPYAVGDHEKFTTIVIPKKRNWAKVEETQNNVNFDGNTESVKMVTLKTLVDSFQIPLNNLLLRMDIEGYEYNVLMNSNELLRDIHNSYITFEFHYKTLGYKKSLELINLFRDNGFILEYIVFNFPHHIYVLPKSIQHIAQVAISLRLDNIGITGETLSGYKAIVDLLDRWNNEDFYFPTPQLYFYKQ